MTRRKIAKASVGTTVRWALTNRSFGDSIHQLTNEAIEQSLLEIEKALQREYGNAKAISRKRDASAEPAIETENTASSS